SSLPKAGAFEPLGRRARLRRLGTRRPLQPRRAGAFRLLPIAKEKLTHDSQKYHFVCHRRLVIDSRGWGHDTDLIVSHDPALLEADPHNNIIFSTHQYRDAASAGQSYWSSTFEKLAESGLAVVIGEFGNSTTDCNVATDYKALIAA